MPEFDSNTLNLESFLPYRLSVLSNTVSGAIAEAYAQRFQLTIPEWRVLAVLARFPDTSARQVSDRTAMDKVAVSRALKRLLQAGYVSRNVAASDRRRSVLQLSADGRALHRQIAPLALDYEQRLLGTLSQEDKLELDRLLDRLMATARSLRPEL